MENYRAIYANHMASKAWQNRREQYFVKHAKKCTACGSKEMIELHHITYDNFTKEPDEDLVPLCQTCHMWVHQIQHKYDISIRDATRIVLSKPRKPKGLSKEAPKPIGRKSGMQFTRLSNTERKQNARIRAKANKKNPS